jgi:tetraacyldisaccharide 4'-kinase
VGGALSLEDKLNGPLGAALAPLGWLFAQIAKGRVSAFQSGRKASVRPPLPTLSIGNISAGGTGKTPLLFAALEWLEKHGATVGVLSRGYGGDEGRMLEERYPKVRLVEGADRVAGMEKLLAGTPPELLLLDDGFQHLRLQRDLDIVVIDATRPFGRCFPAGLFREPISALQRADLIVVSRAELVSEEKLEKIWSRIHRACKGKPFQTRVEGGVQARDLRNLVTGEIMPVEEFAGRSVQLAAGIGNPHSFHALCEGAGFKIENFTRLADHHAWTAADAALFPSDPPLIVTEKDGVKVRPFATEQMWELRVDWKFVRGFEAWERCLTDLHLPVRAAMIEPLWAAQDPEGRNVT